MGSMRSVAVRSVGMLSLCLIGCGGLPSMETHAVLTQPNALPPISDRLFLIGTEKAPRSRIGRPEYKGCPPGKKGCFALDAPEINRDKAGQSLRRDLGKRFREAKSIFVSHVVELVPSGSPIVLYSAYDAEMNLLPDTQLFEKSWDALSIDLFRRLDAAILESEATHLIIMSTGWNTLQADSIKNYVDWMNVVRSEISQVAIRPIYIGVSWASDWQKTNAVTVLDFQNKAHDADELGMLWMNVVVNDVAVRLREEHGIHVVLIGHSFGARVMSRALYSWPLLSTSAPCSSSAGSELFIGLQGAFSFARFVEGLGTEGSPYDDFQSCHTKVLLTTSKFDKAVDASLSKRNLSGNAYVGDDDAFENTRRWPLLFDHIHADVNGQFESSRIARDKVTLLDASLFISDHNDVYDASIGHLIRTAIMEFASP